VKRIISSVFVVFAAIGCTIGPALAGGRECIFRETFNGTERRFFVPTSLLSSPTNCWDLAHKPFPADLRALTEKAEQELRKQIDIKQPIRVALIDVKRRSRLDPNHPERSLDLEPWFIVFRFGFISEEPGFFKRPPNFYVVMLLDGTIAEEEKSR